MARTRATSSEWHQYYERSERVRAVVGDPFKRHVGRVAARHRLYAIGTALYVVAISAAFAVLAMR